LRRKSWVTSRNWSAPEAAEKLIALSNAREFWDPLVVGCPLIEFVDRVLCDDLGARSAEPRALPFESGEPLTIDEVLHLMRIWFPGLDRDELKAMLRRQVRRRLVVRVRPGVYLADPYGTYRRRRESMCDDDEGYAKYRARHRKNTAALMIHVLLPRVASYRKAAAIGMGERNYYLAIAHITDSLSETLHGFEAAQTFWAQRRSSADTIV